MSAADRIREGLRSRIERGHGAVETYALQLTLSDGALVLLYPNGIGR